MPAQNEEWQQLCICKEEQGSILTLRFAVNVRKIEHLLTSGKQFINNMEEKAVI
jgi:hypothetical protein